jgi:hypothetical protein
MTLPEKKHTKDIQDRLLKLDEDRAALLDHAHKGFAYPGAPGFELDILAFGSAKRVISATSALKLLVESWNLVTACFREATEMLAHYLHRYAQTKKLPPDSSPK